MKPLAVILVLVISGVPIARGDDPAALAEQKFQELYGQKVRQASLTSNTDDDLRLAQEMLDASTTTDDLPLKTRLCKQACELAKRAQGGAGVATAAVEFLYAMDPTAERWCREQVIDLRLQQYRTAGSEEKAEIGREIVDLAMLSADDRGAEGDYAGAIAMCRQALGVSNQIGGARVREIGRKISHLSSQKELQARFEMLRKKVAAEDDDPSARMDLIAFCVVEKDEPARAARYLNRDVDEVWRTYVPLAAEDPNTLAPEACLELGRWYESLARTATSAGRSVTLNRAVTYYQQFLADPDRQDPTYLQARLARDCAVLALRSRGEMTEAMPLLAPVLVMTFERGSFENEMGESRFRDLSGDGNNGMATGTEIVEGRAGAAVQFAGRGGIDLGNPKGLRLTGDATIAFWIRPDEIGARRNVYTKAFGGEGAVTLEPNGALSFSFGTSGRNSDPSEQFPMPAPLKAGQWTHVAVVRDIKAKTVTWYMDGRAVASSEFESKAPALSLLSTYIGKGYAEPFVGAIDELAVFALPLDARDIALLFELGQVGQPLR